MPQYSPSRCWGWTVDEELARPRPFPNAGFARVHVGEGRRTDRRTEGVLVLNYGPRTFTVKLNDELEPAITTADGKTLKNLPAIGKSDDAEPAKAARKAFTEAKKVVKEVVKRQSERLYEALCTQRFWRFAEWQQYLAAHPIAGRLCVRLAWAAFNANTDQFLGCFRPLEDGSLTNEKDEEVTFEPEVRVRLAHACNTPAEVGAAWAQHFTDYDVEPLFQQFGRATYTLPAGKETETDVKDFEGHGLTTFKLPRPCNEVGLCAWRGGEGRRLFLPVSQAISVARPASGDRLHGQLPTGAGHAGGVDGDVFHANEGRVRGGVVVEPVEAGVGQGADGAAERVLQRRQAARGGRQRLRLEVAGEELFLTSPASPKRKARARRSISPLLCGGNRPEDGFSGVTMTTQAKEMLREPAEVRYAAELSALAAADSAARPPGWKLSPRAVTHLHPRFWHADRIQRRVSLAGASDSTLTITRKFHGDDPLIDRPALSR